MVNIDSRTKMCRFARTYVHMCHVTCIHTIVIHFLHYFSVFHFSFGAIAGAIPCLLMIGALLDIFLWVRSISYTQGFSEEYCLPYACVCVLFSQAALLDTHTAWGTRMQKEILIFNCRHPKYVNCNTILSVLWIAPVHYNIFMYANMNTYVYNKIIMRRPAKCTSGMFS